MKTSKTMGKSRIHNEIKELTDSKLREAIQSLKNVTWKENDLLRVLARKIHGEDNIMTMLTLALPLAIELEQRTRTDSVNSIVKSLNPEKCNWIPNIWDLEGTLIAEYCKECGAKREFREKYTCNRSF